MPARGNSELKNLESSDNLTALNRSAEIDPDFWIARSVKFLLAIMRLPLLLDLQKTRHQAGYCLMPAFTLIEQK